MYISMIRTAYVVLLSLSKTLDRTCFSSRRSIRLPVPMRGEMDVVFDSHCSAEYGIIITYSCIHPGELRKLTLYYRYRPRGIV